MADMRSPFGDLSSAVVMLLEYAVSRHTVRMTDDAPHNAVAWMDEYRAWLAAIMAARPGLTPTQMARDIGLSPSSLTRHMQPNFTRQPRIETLRKIASHYGVAIPQRLLGSTEPPRGFAETDAEPLSGYDVSEPGWNANQSDWRVKSGVLAAMGCMPGDTIRFDAAVEPVFGDIVIAQHYRPRHTNADTVMRLYMPPYLVAAEIGRPSIEPITIGSDNVVIMGTMVKRWSLRRTSHSSGAPGANQSAA